MYFLQPILTRCQEHSSAELCTLYIWLLNILPLRHFQSHGCLKPWEAKVLWF